MRNHRLYVCQALEEEPNGIELPNMKDMYKDANNSASEEDVPDNNEDDDDGDDQHPVMRYVPEGQYLQTSYYLSYKLAQNLLHVDFGSRFAADAILL